MGDVIDFNGMTVLDIPADKVLEKAIGELDDVVVLGHTAEGKIYFAGSSGDTKETLWLLERAIYILMSGEDNV